MRAAYHTTRRVEFRDTDAAGLMHFSVFFVMMEEAEHKLLRSVGTSVVLHDEQGLISWPRVAAECQYLGVARFEDLLDIHVEIERLGNKSITYAFDFTCQGREVARGKLTTVCCRISSDSSPTSIPIPPDIVSKLGAISAGDSEA